MTFEAYLAYWEDILTHPESHEKYRNEEYLNYTKLNWSRTNRWLKKFEPSPEIIALIDSIQQKQHWILITEPWCGDAAHSVPQIFKIARRNPNIELDIQLRDTEPFLIDQYLTNGGKSIPKLIIRNNEGHDIATWGPRPQKLDVIFQDLKKNDLPFDDIKEIFQKWYNEDKGIELQQELLLALR